VPLGSIVEATRAGVREVSEAVPLRPGLRVERVQVVIGDVLMKRFDLVFETLASKGGLCRDIEREAGSCQSSGCMLGRIRRTSPVQYHRFGSPSLQPQHVPVSEDSDDRSG
jgi:hypothetical protein